MKKVIIHSILVIILVAGYVTGRYLKERIYVNNQGVKVSIDRHKHKQHHHATNKKYHRVMTKIHGFNIQKGENQTAKTVLMYTSPIFLIIIIYLILRFKAHIQWLKFSNTLFKKLLVIIHILYFIDIILSLSSGLLYGFALLFFDTRLQSMLILHKLTSNIFLQFTIFHILYALYYALIKKSNFCRKMIFLKPIKKPTKTD